VNGGGGNDQLQAVSTASTLTFQLSQTSDLAGQAGFDKLNAFDGDLDHINCGGDGFSRLSLDRTKQLVDTAFADLKDEVTGCAAIERTPIAVGPNVRIRTGSAEVHDGRVDVRLACPRSKERFGTDNARISRCKGRLKLKEKGQALDSERFNVAVGGSESVTLEVGDARGIARAIATEESPRGDKTTISPLELE
jgi:hypothetical protein